MRAWVALYVARGEKVSAAEAPDLSMITRVRRAPAPLSLFDEPPR